jgi:nucleoside-diphosphate-sugar epimerase
VSASVVVTGATGPLGRRVVARIAADPGVSRVLAVDAPAAAGAEDVETLAGIAGAPVEVHLLDLTDPALPALVQDAGAVVHLGVREGTAGPGQAPEALDGTGVVSGPSAGTRHLLEVAADQSVRTRVLSMPWCTAPTRTTRCR